MLQQHRFAWMRRMGWVLVRFASGPAGIHAALTAFLMFFSQLQLHPTHIGAWTLFPSFSSPASCEAYTIEMPFEDTKIARLKKHSDATKRRFDLSVSALSGFPMRLLGAKHTVPQQNPLSGADNSIEYVYAPLDQALPSIRLVEIKSDLSSDGLVQCNLIHTTTRAVYDCLSYVWGDPEPAQHILVDGRRFRVRQNLFDFLDMARGKTRGMRQLWVDALCIDQNNILERNHQVQQMGKVYAHASKVFIWLGKHAGYANTLRAMKAAGSAFRRRAVGKEATVVDYRLFHDAYWNRAWV